MKKFLAVMLIAMIAVVGVFATDVTGPTSVTLNYSITEVFTLAYKLSAVSKKGDNEVETKSLQASNFAIDAGSNADKFAAGKVLFDIMDASYVNKTTPEIVKVGVTCSANWTHIDGETTGPAITLSAITKADDATGSTNAIGTGDDTGKLIVTYATTVVDRTSTAANVGSFDVSWEADTNPRKSGNWSATVTLAFSAN